jgi:hypothetical protein
MCGFGRVFGLWWSQGDLERYCLGNDWHLPYAVCRMSAECRVGDVILFLDYLSHWSKIIGWGAEQGVWPTRKKPIQDGETASGAVS